MEEIQSLINDLDSTAPVITITGDNPMTLEASSTYVELGATAYD